MGLFKKRDAEELERLRTEMSSMAARLDAAEASKQALGNEVHELRARLEIPITEPPEPPPPPAPTIDPAEIEALNARLQRIDDRLDQADARVTSISTELANQLTELSGDIEALSNDEAPTEQVVDELRDAQSRLANEQARYQIAFRQDLAELADRLKRS